MQNFRCVRAFAVAAAVCAWAALALGYVGWSGAKAKVEAAIAPQETVIAGAAWRCEGDTCLGAAPRKGTLDGVVRECKKVVAVVGPVASYRSGGRELTDGQIRACNKAAPQMLTAQK
jgi:hypothetical protein